ncbi:baseplate wedge subunit [uncultured Caudovirales phage]|uniref:Baseplate wedge subunit n=1 Tax=uncultured Caudovirales phage TaxID=2100421 RepID=A0A6J5KP97_9CAUD|nr:baseplate wedge subunit [uncultured Caudovirales phage]
MLFFSKYKSLQYALDESNYELKTVKNIFTKIKFVKEVLDNTDLFYKYTMKGDDTPETIAHKLYGDANRYWIVLLANGVVDPYYDVPLKYGSFENHLVDKYGSITYAQANIHHYEKQVTTKTDKNGIINSQTYVTELTSRVYNQATGAIETITLPTLSNPIIQESMTQIIIPDSDGIDVTITVTTNYVAISIYDYENNLNENKRSIRLIKPEYVDKIETEFAGLLGT